MVSARTTLHHLGRFPQGPSSSVHFVHSSDGLRICFTGGAAAAPSWAKMWLAVLNCYSWDGMNVVPPEMLLQPKCSPGHLSKFWIFMRSVYVPFAFLYGKVRCRFHDVVKKLALIRFRPFTQRFSCPEDELIKALREVQLLFLVQ